MAMAVLVGVAVVAGVSVVAQGTVPGAPGNLTYQVSGGSVWLNWISSTGMVESFNPTTSFYRLEAGDSPGTTFFTWDSSQLNDPTKMPHLLTSFATSGVPTGNYYVRVRGVANGVVGPPSNEVLVPVTGACQPPAPPTDFTAITRADWVFLAWNDGSGGGPTRNDVHARQQSGGPVIASLGATRAPGHPGGTLNVSRVPAGTYYLQVTASNACGTSAFSTEIVVSSPNNAPSVRTPNAPSGRLPWFDIRPAVAFFAGEAVSAGYLSGVPGVSNDSCRERPGFPFTTDPNNPVLELQKTQRNRYIDHVVRRLRELLDPRFGYNAKPTRENAIVAGDEIAYHWGSDASQGSPSVYLIDVLGGHCTFGRETPDFRPFFNEYGRWTATDAFVP
jgi:hypothetical protein